MDDHKKIDLQRHVSKKVPKSYLWRIVVYCLLIGGIIGFIFYLKNEESAKDNKKLEDINEIDDFEVEESPINTDTIYRN